jgi:hypothetical protein
LTGFRGVPANDSSTVTAAPNRAPDRPTPRPPARCQGNERRQETQPQRPRDQHRRPRSGGRRRVGGVVPRLGGELGHPLGQRRTRRCRPPREPQQGVALGVDGLVRRRPGRSSAFSMATRI